MTSDDAARASKRSKGRAEMNYAIRGRFLSEGEETPHFDVHLYSCEVPLVRIRNDGRGGQCRIDWTENAPPGSATRANVVAWLEGEAHRIWRAMPRMPWETDADRIPPSHILKDPEESATIVVSEYLR